MEELKALVDEAHAFDLKVSSHAYDARPSVENAVLAGVDNIDHGIYLDEEVVQLMKEHGTTLVPTLSVIKIIYEQGEKARTTNPYRIPDIVEKAKQVTAESGLVIMSIQYRKENFACLCKVEDLNAEYVSVKPLALVLSEDQKEHITDVLGNRPESGLRKKLDLE